MVVNIKNTLESVRGGFFRQPFKIGCWRVVQVTSGKCSSLKVKTVIHCSGVSASFDLERCCKTASEASSCASLGRDVPAPALPNAAQISPAAPRFPSEDGAQGEQLAGDRFPSSALYQQGKKGFARGRCSAGICSVLPLSLEPRSSKCGVTHCHWKSCWHLIPKARQLWPMRGLLLGLRRT